MNSTSACASSIPNDIAFTTGPTMLGVCFNWCFFGFLIPQIYYYHSTYPSDKTWLQCLVYGLALLDFLQTVMVTADTFHWFVFGFGNMTMLNDAFLNPWDIPFLDALIATIAHTFYCWRIYVLRQSSYVMPLVIMLVSLCQCGAGMAVGIKAFKLAHLSLISENLVPEVVWLSGSALADVLITATLSYTLLNTASSRQTLPASRRMINKIVRLNVETNALTAGTALFALVIYVAVPSHTTFVIPPTAIMGKLYSNCLVAVLNNRRLVQEPNESTSRPRRSSDYYQSFRIAEPIQRPPKNDIYATVKVVRSFEDGVH